jgi:hypothetical protein
MTFDDTDQSDGATISDHSDYGNHGTNVGATKGTGRNGVAKYFDGVDDCVEVPITTAFVDALTIASWIKTSLTEAQRIFDQYNSTPSNIGFRLSSTNQLQFIYQNGTPDDVYDTTATIVTDSWAYVVVTIDDIDNPDRTVKFYINGTLVTSSQSTDDNPTAISETIETNIGKKGSDTQYFNGTIDEVAIWNRVLSAQEIKDLYEGGL